MGLRCSLLGHDFGESEVETERERDGSEVVITTREFERCTRCGERRLVSENKGVTSASSLSESDTGADDGGTTGSEAPDDVPSDGPTAGDDEGVAAETATDEPAIVDDGPDDATLIDDDVTETDSPASAGVDVTATAEEGEGTDAGDDAVIIDAEDGDGGDDPATGAPAADAGPESADADAADASPPTETSDGSTDDATGAESEAGDPTDDAVILDDDADDSDGERAHGEWPDHDVQDQGFSAGDSGEVVVEETGDGPETTSAAAGTSTDHEPYPEVERTESRGGAADAEWVDPDRTDREDDGVPEGTGITSAESITGEDAAAGPTNYDTELVCPECGYAARRGPSSLRRGDICPECQRGYIAERDG